MRILNELESIYCKMKDNETERKPGVKALSMVPISLVVTGKFGSYCSR